MMVEMQPINKLTIIDDIAELPLLDGEYRFTHWPTSKADLAMKMASATCGQWVIDRRTSTIVQIEKITTRNKITRQGV